MADFAYYPAPSQLTFGPTTTDLVRTLLKACASPHTRRAYAKAIAELDVYAEGRTLTRLLILDWRCQMDRDGLAVSSINSRLTGVRKLIHEARRARLLDANDAAQLLDVPNLPQRGIATGTWLTADQCRRLLAVPDRTTRRGLRNFCILAILLGCGLRRAELAALTVDHLDMEDEHWIIRNLRGKGGRVRTVALPPFVRSAIAAWMEPTGIRSGLIIRQLTLDPAGLSVGSIWEIVSSAALKIGFHDFTPHDLRRTCAKLSRKAGGELEQIQFMLGHSSLVTTQRYLGTTQDIPNAPNNALAF